MGKKIHNLKVENYGLFFNTAGNSEKLLQRDKGGAQDIEEFL